MRWSTRTSPSPTSWRPRGAPWWWPSTSGTSCRSGSARCKALREALAERLAQVPGVPLVTLSALAGQGLDKLQSAVFAAYERWNRRVPTPDLNRWLAEAIERHNPPAAKGRRIKLRFMTQVSARPPTFVAFCSQPQGLPQAYLRYLTNSLRSTFDLPGVPIRLKLRKGDNPYARG